MDPRAGTERLVLLVETRLTQTCATEALRRRITEATSALLGVPPDEVIFASPHTVPKTSSGKVRRSAARAIYERGAWSAKGRALWWQLARLALAGLGTRWRRLGQRLGDLTYAAYWWGLLTAASIVLWPMIVLLPRRRWRHSAIHGAARTFLRLAGLSPKVTAESEVPMRGMVLAANHSSYLDSAVLAAVIPGRLSFVAKEELARQWIAGLFLSRIGTLFVRRTDAVGGVEDTRRTLEAVRAGERVVSFPEGTLTRMPGLLPFRLGAFLAAAEACIPVVPVTIRGTRSVLRGGQWFPRRSEIAVHLGKSLRAQGTDFAAAVRLRDATRAHILDHCHEPDLGHETVRR
jgi:1-acyl-sn-glycerol-3-phosphate acyltransferase